MYPINLTAPMAQELTEHGFESMTTAQAVDDVLSKKEGTVLVMINSVCGCAAANARPGVKMAIQHDKVPSKLTTVFAGVDKEAVDKARNYMMPYPPSSPSIALFKDGKLVHFVERLRIEGHRAQDIAEGLKMAFDKYC